MAKPKKYRDWVKLDNAAKVFPSTTDKRDSKVFRFTCELKEQVDAQILQKALDETLLSYSGFLTVLKHGFFWYYLESTDLKPEVHIENKQICSPLYDKNEDGLLFDVSYFGTRINLEVYHVLTDGTGALEFLRHMTCTYLAMLHAAELAEAPRFSGRGVSVTEKMEDSFQKYYDPKKKRGKKRIQAYKVTGARLPEDMVKVVEGILPADKLVALARSYDTTITIFLTAILLCAVHENRAVREYKKPVCMAIPVNLRRYFASDSTRNFFCVTHIRYYFEREKADLREVIRSVSAQFQENLTVEKLSESINTFVSIEKNAAVRAVPLAIKDFFIRKAYQLNDRAITGSFSNIGVVELPKEYVKYVRMFDVMISTRKLQICMCSFENNLVVNFTDSFVSTDIPKYFFRTLSGMGIPMEIASNPVYEERGKRA